MDRVKSVVFRLYPTKQQEKSFNLFRIAVGEVYNYLLTFCKNLIAFGLPIPTEFEMRGVALRYSKDIGWMNGVASRCITNAGRRICQAFDRYFDRKKKGLKGGFPRYKSVDRRDSFCYDDRIGYRFSNEKDKLPGKYYLRLGNIGFVKYRNPFKIPVKNLGLTVSRRKEGRYYNWYASINYVYKDYEAGQVLLDSIEPCAVGIDMGLESRMAFSDGTCYSNSHLFRNKRKCLAKLQSRIYSLDKEDPDRERLSAKISHIIKKINNKRKEENNKTVNAIINTYDILALEDLNVEQIISKSKTSERRNLFMDASWSTLLNHLYFKAEEAGVKIIHVDPSNTSQECSVCGKIVKKDQTVRIHNCPYCGFVEDRDINAARNILQRGLGLQTLSNSKGPHGA